MRQHTPRLRPRWPFTINRDSWESQGLLAWFPYVHEIMPNGLIDLVGGLVVPFVGGAGPAPTRVLNADCYGVEHTSAGVGAEATTPAYLKGLTSLTILWMGVGVGTPSAFGSLFSTTYDNINSSPFYGYGLSYTGGADALRGAISDSAGVHRTVEGVSGDVLVQGGFYSVIFTIMDGAQALYLNGDTIATGTWSFNGGNHQATSLVTFGTQISPAATMLDARIYNYAWSATQARAQTELYWDLYRRSASVYIGDPTTEPTTTVPVPEDPCTIRTPRWAAGLRLFHSEDGDTGVGYIGKLYGKGPFRDPSDYYYGYKEPRLLDAGTIRMAASDWLTGAVPAQSATARFADTDRYLRTQMDGNHPLPAVFPPSFSNKSQLYLYLVADSTRRALSADWRLLFRGIISDDPLSEHLTYTVTAKDVFGSDYHLFRDDKMIPQRTISNNDFTSYPDSGQFNGVPIIGGNVTDENDANVGAIQLIYVGPLTVNSVTKDCWLIAGHACKAIRLYQGGTEIATSDANAWWPGSNSWTTFVPSNAKYVDINSRRYSLAFLDGTRATDAIDGTAPLYANVQGVTTNAQGTGTLITDYFELYYHLCTQWLSQSYLTGDWADVPTFPFVPKPTTLDTDPAFLQTFLRSSFTTASTTFNSNFGTPPIGGFVLGAGGRRQSIRQVLADLNLSGNCLLGPNQYSQMMINVLDLNRTSFLANSRSVGKVDILRDSFRAPPQRDWLGNHLSYRYNANYRGDSGPEYYGSGELIHTVSDHLYGRIDVSRTYAMVTDAATADAVAGAQRDFGAHPRRIPEWKQSLCGLANPLLAGVPFSHYGGASATGWTNRALWKVLMDVDTRNCTVASAAIDVDDLLV